MQSERPLESQNQRKILPQEKVGGVSGVSSPDMNKKDT
jgi:hypothetical protein